MEFSSRWKFWPVLAALIGLVAFGCTRHSTDNNETFGTQDPGGGTVFNSSVDEVNSALDLAIKMASAPDLQNNLAMQFWKDKGRTSSVLLIKHPDHLFSKMGETVNFSSPELEALSRNQLVRLPKGDCPHPSDETDADASVSTHSLAATICFSIGNLRRVAPPLLLREILSLAIHEAAHMGGADEAEARAWQREFYAYFGDRFGDLSSDDITVASLRAMAEAKELIQKAKSRAVVDVDDARIFGIIGDLGNKMSELPYRGDPIALKLKLNPIRPDLIGDYQGAITLLVTEISLHFEQYGPSVFLDGTLQPMSRSESWGLDDIQFKISEFGHQVDSIYERFLAFTGTANNPKFQCLFDEVKAGGIPAIPSLSIISGVTNTSVPCPP